VLPRIACARGLLVGDAAGAVSPLTAGGLDPCLRLSALAAAVAVDFLDTVRSVQSAGIQIAYPGSLPEGWIAQEPTFTPGDRPVWMLPMLTDAGKYVGIHQADAPLTDMLATDMPKGARQGEDVQIDSALPGDQATTWSSWSDGTRDHGFATTVGDDTLLVYGSAPVEDLKKLIGLLTTAPAS
jgi:hypothetical protein